MNYKKIKIRKFKGETIDKIVGHLITKGTRDLDEIKQYISDTNEIKGAESIEDAANLVKVILSTKKQGDKIILKDGTFTKPLHTYLSYSGISLKCLTNDRLFIRMICKKIQDLKQYYGQVPELLSNSLITNVTITSQNFEYDTNATTGLIQDFEPGFSCICTDAARQTKDLQDVVKDKPNEGTFELYGDTFRFFGTPDIGIICDPNLSDKDILEKIDGMKYLKTVKNKLKEGERFVNSNGKIKYLYQDIKPEEFCPAYWMSPVEVRCNFLFTFELDYNEIFDFCYSEEDKKVYWPSNCLYWDNMKSFFDFVEVMALTHPKMDNSTRARLHKYVIDYYNNDKILNEMKKVHLAIERVFKDYLNTFLNNSGYNRVDNLREKVRAVLDDLEEVLKDEDYADASAFICNLDAPVMMKNQLKNIPRLRTILSNMNSVLTKYLSGKNASSIVSDIRQCASEITPLLPGESIANAYFPFIVANGPLLGDLITFGNRDSDGLFKRISVRIESDTKKQKKLKEQTKKEANTMELMKAKFDMYFRTYLNARPKKGYPSITQIEYLDAMKILKEYLFGLTGSDPEFLKALATANEAIAQKKYKFKKDPLIEQFILDYLGAINVKTKKAGKKATVSKKFGRTIKKMGLSFDIEDDQLHSDSDSDMDIDDQPKTKKKKKLIKPKMADDKKEEDKKDKTPRGSITGMKTRRQKKKEDMDISSDSDNDDNETPGK